MLMQFDIEADVAHFRTWPAICRPRALGMTTVLLREPDTPDYGGPVGDEHIDHYAPNAKDILARILDHLSD